MKANHLMVSEGGMAESGWVVGDERSITVQVTDEMVRKFADVSGDYNPIHLDDAFAATTRFKKRIAHGMISGALISRALATGGGVWLSQSMKFLKPVFIEDTITVKLKLLSIRESRGLMVIETTCTNQNGEDVVKGEAVILQPEFV